MRRTLRTLSALLATFALAPVLAGCGDSGTTARPRPAADQAASQTPGGGGATAPVPHGHPQTIDPVAGGAAAVAAAGPAAGPTLGSAPAGPSAAKSPTGAQPLSDAQVRSELAGSGNSANPDQGTLIPGGLAIAPVAAPAAVQAVMNAGNQIARLPYRFGGGHGTFEDTEYDCSGSLSFVLAAAGLLKSTLTSGDLENWGAAGRGRWITIFANAGHTFMYVAGLRFDTVALAETGSRWSNRSATERDGFAVRHPPGL